MKIVVCPFCKKEFKSQGIGGHIWRSHSLEGIEAGRQARLKAVEVRKTLPGTMTGKRHSKETKDKISAKRVEFLHTRKFFSKPEIYKGILLDSSYESKVARELDNNFIDWIRPKSLIYFDGMQRRRYVPDFYLSKFDVYLDPKNDWLIIKDQKKIEYASVQNNVKIFVLNKTQLNWNDIKKIITTSEQVFREVL